MRFVIDNPPSTSPRRPAVRAGITRTFNGYLVPGAHVLILAWPHRPLSHARQLARRVHRAPADYLPVLSIYAVPGIVHVDPKPSTAATAA